MGKNILTALGKIKTLAWSASLRPLTGLAERETSSEIASYRKNRKW
jgi:hypothetical protein